MKKRKKCTGREAVGVMSFDEEEETEAEDVCEWVNDNTVYEATDLGGGGVYVYKGYH